MRPHYTAARRKNWKKGEIEGFINIGDSDIEDFFVPDSFSNRYNTEKPRKLGKGGYGTVMFLENTIGGRHVAVKRFDGPFKKAKIAQRCFRELQLLRELRHDNIVKMTFVHTTDKTIESLSSVYLTEEYCGNNLGYCIAKQTEADHFTFRCIQKIIYELLRALKYLHSVNVIHRDLTPANIAITTQLTLIDFGLARVKDEQMTSGTGVAYYRAIETIDFNYSNKTKCYDEKTEMWSMGAILCEMLTGQILFKIDNDNDNDNQKDGETVQRAIEICGPIPDCVLLRINNKDAQERFRKKNANARRIDFLDKFRAEARPWLKEGIEINRVNLKDFIDHTLAFDPDERMSVDEALYHPFLAEVREPLKEVSARLSIPDIPDQTTDQWRAHIWPIIRQYDSANLT